MATGSHSRLLAAAALGCASALFLLLRRALRARVQQPDSFGDDVRCSSCSSRIGPAEPRWRCVSCDAYFACAPCSIYGCRGGCGVGQAAHDSIVGSTQADTRLFRQRASLRQTIDSVHTSSYSSAQLLRRAFSAFEDEPFLGFARAETPPESCKPGRTGRNVWLGAFAASPDGTEPVLPVPPPFNLNASPTNPAHGLPAHISSDMIEWQWLRFGDVGAAAELLARALRAALSGHEVDSLSAADTTAPDTAPSRGAHPCDDAAVVLWAPNSAAWVVADLACTLAGLPSLVLPSTLDPAAAAAAALEAAAAIGRQLALAIVPPEDAAAFGFAAGLPVVLPPAAADTPSAGGRSHSARNGAREDGDPRLLALSLCVGRAPLREIERSGRGRRGAHSRADCGSASAGPLGRSSTELPAVPCAPRDAFTAFFTAGATGGPPRARWLDESTWRARNTGVRASHGVSCVPILTPLSHHVARSQVWTQLLTGGRAAMLHPHLQPVPQLSTLHASSLSAPPHLLKRLDQLRREARAAGASRADALVLIYI